MDEADLRIVRALLADPLASVASLARTARLGDSATRARVRRLRDGGTLGQISALPNGRLLGQDYIVALYRDEDWRALFDIPSVVGCSINHEGVVAPTALTTTDDIPDDLRARCGEPERTFVQHNEPLVPPGVELSDVQWRVLTAFVADPLASDRALAKGTGLGARTVKRHRQAFLEGGHVRLEVQVRSLRGDHVLFHVYVQGPASHDAALHQRIAESYAGAWPQQYLGAPKGVLLFCAARDLADAAAAPQRAVDLDGVDHAELVVSRDGAYAKEKLVAACEKAAEAQRDARRANRA